jgi:hypothetical protein
MKQDTSNAYRYGETLDPFISYQPWLFQPISFVFIYYRIIMIYGFSRYEEHGSSKGQRLDSEKGPGGGALEFAPQMRAIPLFSFERPKEWKAGFS